MFLPARFYRKYTVEEKVFTKKSLITEEEEEEY